MRPGVSYNVCAVCGKTVSSFYAFGHRSSSLNERGDLVLHGHWVVCSRACYSRLVSKTESEPCGVEEIP